VPSRNPVQDSKTSHQNNHTHLPEPWERGSCCACLQLLRRSDSRGTGYCTFDSSESGRVNIEGLPLAKNGAQTSLAPKLLNPRSTQVSAAECLARSMNKGQFSPVPRTLEANTHLFTTHLSGSFQSFEGSAPTSRMFFDHGASQRLKRSSC
jgi:hypothetical protein